MTVYGICYFFLIDVIETPHRLTAGMRNVAEAVNQGLPEASLLLAVVRVQG